MIKVTLERVKNDVYPVKLKVFNNNLPYNLNGYKVKFKGKNANDDIVESEGTIDDYTQGLCSVTPPKEITDTHGTYSIKVYLENEDGDVMTIVSGYLNVIEDDL